MKQRRGKGEENALEKTRKTERMHVWKGKGHVHTVYSQMNERMTGEVMKNHVKKQKSRASRKCECEFGEKSSFVSFWSYVFSPFSRKFDNSYPSIPPS